MRALITGATGLVGNNVLRMLLESGCTARVLVRERSDPRPTQGLDVEVVTGDIRDQEAVRRACQGVTCVIHAAAHVHIGWSGLELQREVNVEGTRNVAAAALDEGLRMVHVSTVDTLPPGRPEQPADEETPDHSKVPCSYVVSKREAEQVLREFLERGLQAVIVNPGFMLGPWDWKPSSGRMLLEVARRFTPVAPSGGCTICDVRDVVAGILLAQTQGQVGRRYILGGYRMTYFEIWKLFARVSGAQGPWVKVRRLAGVGGRFGDLLTRLTGREPDVNSAATQLSNMFHYYSSKRAETELGYSNRPLEETVYDAWNWFQAHGYA